MSADELYVKDARVWVKDAEIIWKGAILLENYTGQKELRVESEEDGREETITIASRDSLPPLRNPDILIGENDLTSMSYLNEPEVLYNLQVRFAERNYIYTYCGIVLVAINPYEELHIYGNETIQAYSGQDMGAMDPHIYAVAEEAFKQMSRFDRNQSIIVSGESGAGKTVSAKYAMRYFAVVGGSSSDETQVERKVLASNPIMEAIGNAKTTRNDNSSRFGKYIQIDFHRNLSIVGAHMRTYLLEKSRVCFQAEEERNYHVFYQLCASADLPEFSKLKLAHADDFIFTSNGGNAVIDNVDDAEDLQSLKDAFELLGIHEKEQMAIFEVLAAVLHLGNIVLSEHQGDSSKVKERDEHIGVFCDLLGIERTQTALWLCNRQIQTVGENLTKPLTVDEASFSRDALAKHIYSQLFDHIVRKVNNTLASKTQTHKFIGVLDIYGFETFETNSFEQFCINYANEKLQQQFNMHVFKLEQEEYIREKIEWSMIDFYDNQPCIDLIEAKLGILDLLDEECMMPKGSDENWCRKMYEKHSKAKHFEKPRMSNNAFIVHHFADNVQYDSSGFLDKNRDTVLEVQLNILRASTSEFVADLFQGAGEPTATAGAKKTGPGARSGSRVQVRAGQKQPKGASKGSKKTVGSQFRDSLGNLMTTLSSTTPHYVRCIKPNDMKAAFEFEPNRAIQQLRACGVLETIRISAAGYPSRWTYAEFFQRYKVLAKFKKIDRQDIRKTCEYVLNQLITDPDKYQFGKTKIFFRAGQVAYMEKLRSDKLKACGIMIQKHVRGWIWRRKYQKIRRSVLLLQTHSRALLARRLAQKLRQTAAVIRLQKCWRGYSCRKQFFRKRNAIVTIQTFARGVLARRRYMELLRNAKAIVLQKNVRRWATRSNYLKMRHGFIKLQGLVRIRMAKKELKQLKIEARSVDHIKQVNKGLENKIIELQQKLEGKKLETKAADEGRVKLQSLQEEVGKLRGADTGRKQASNRITDLEEELERVKAELEVEREEKKDVISEKDKLYKDTKFIIEQLTNERDDYKRQVEDTNEAMESQKVDVEGVLREKVEAERHRLLHESEAEREHHQRLVKDYGRLQQRFDNLLSEKAAMLSPPAHAKLRGHERANSDVSSISLDSEDIREDLGYGTARKLRDRSIPGVDQIQFEQPGSHADQSLTPTESTSASGSPTEGAPPSSVLSDGKDSSSSVNEEQEKVGLSEKRDISEKHEVRRDNKQRTSSGSTKMAGELPSLGNIDLMLKLQNRVKDLERDKQQLRNEMESESERRPRSDSTFSELAYDSQKIQELEMENDRLRGDLRRLQTAVAEQKSDPDGPVQASRELMEQFGCMSEELARRREECLQLKAVLSSQTKDTSEVAKESYGGDPELLNEDGELVVAYKTQKDLNRLLQTEMEREKKFAKKLEAELREQIEELRSDNDRQQRLIGQGLEQDYKGENLTMNPEMAIEATMQYEITRLTTENLDLREKIDRLEAKGGKLRKALNTLKGRIRDNKLDVSNMSAELEELESAEAAGADGVVPRRSQDRVYSGMIEFKKEDEQRLVRSLVLDYRPQSALTLMPALPAQLLFMCLRHTDYVNDDGACKSLLTSTINGIKRTVKQHRDDVDTLILWLSNTCRFLHNLKQYSGDQMFQTENTGQQSTHCLVNFDLSEYRQILSDLAVMIYQALIKLMQESVHPMIVPAILEHEGIQGISSSSKPAGRYRSLSQSNGLDDNKPLYSFDTLMVLLNTWIGTLRTFAVDQQVITQIYRQLFYFVGAGATNNLLLRKDMCNWAKGMQIRYNLSNLEQWIRDNKLSPTYASPATGGPAAGTCLAALEPLVQATQLLQVSKTVSDVGAICDLCSALTAGQIVKILHLYTPFDEYEEKVPVSFIRSVQHELKGRRATGSGTDPPLLIDTKHVFPVTFPFVPSTFHFDTIDIPEILSLKFLKRI